MHPLVAPESIRKNSGCTNRYGKLNAGDRAVHVPDGRVGTADEFLHDGDALITWDDGSFGIVKWANLKPE